MLLVSYSHLFHFITCHIPSMGIFSSLNIQNSRTSLPPVSSYHYQNQHHIYKHKHIHTHHCIYLLSNDLEYAWRNPKGSLTCELDNCVSCCVACFSKDASHSWWPWNQHHTHNDAAFLLWLTSVSVILSNTCTNANTSMYTPSHSLSLSNTHTQSQTHQRLDS